MRELYESTFLVCLTVGLMVRMWSGKRKVRSCVMAKAECRETTTMKCASRDCHSSHLLADWSELAFSVSER